VNPEKKRTEERKMKRLIGLGLGLSLLIGCGGGAKYWMVTDPSTKNVYYTQGVNSLSGGAVKFTDAQTGSAITLQNSGVKKMTEQEFKAAVGNVEKKSAEEKKMNGYAVLKGGYFFPSGEFQKEGMNGNTYWGLAGGLDFLRFFGVELGVGYLQAQNSQIDVYAVPLLLSGKAQFPIDIRKNLDHLLFFVPYLKAGGGYYYVNGSSRTGQGSDSTWALGWQAGGGFDFWVGPVILGIEAKYQGVDASLKMGDVNLDGTVTTANIGFRF
jgi:hypothetical protein